MNESSMTTQIPEEVFRFFAAHPAGPMLTLAREASDPPDGLRVPLEHFLASFGSDEVAAVQADEHFRFFSHHREDEDRAARVWLAERLLSSEIARRRLEAIREDHRNPRPRPYDQPALQDLSVGADHLVPLSAFTFDGARLIRNEFAFLVLSTTGSPNSTHWLLASLYEQGLSDYARVRLDPFLCGRAASYPAMFYRMWVYGRPLDWPRVHAIKEPDHGRWLPDSARAGGRFTDFAWVPRGDEVHFVCEEVPQPEAVATQAARYLHAVYSRETRMIAHFDGALRLYTRPDVLERGELHARHAGKMGLREKVFLVDGPREPDALSQVAQAFFVWNEDVETYFSKTIAAAETT